MNPQKLSYLFLVVLLCLSVNFAHKFIDDDDQYHKVDDKGKQDRFGNKVNQIRAGAGIGMQFHEDNGAKEKQDRFGNKINPTRASAGVKMQLREYNDKEKQVDNSINPTGGGGGMGMPYGWPKIPYHQPCLGPQCHVNNFPLPNPGFPYVYDRPGTGCPCTVQCYHQYKMKLRQLRKALRINELLNAEADEDLATSGGIDESVGSLGQFYP